MSVAEHGTLVANTVKTVTLVAPAGAYWVAITNRSGFGEMYITMDSTSPTIEGGASYVVLGHRTFRLESNTLVVKIISDRVLDYSVEAYS